MFDVYPAAWFSSGTSLAVVGIFIGLQVVSLVILLLAVWEFRQLRGRHAAFFNAVSNVQKDHEARPQFILWLYVFSTVFLLIASSILFFFQPHWL